MFPGRDIPSVPFAASLFPRPFVPRPRNCCLSVSTSRLPPAPGLTTTRLLMKQVAGQIKLLSASVNYARFGGGVLGVSSLRRDFFSFPFHLRACRCYGYFRPFGSLMMYTGKSVYRICRGTRWCDGVLGGFESGWRHKVIIIIIHKWV